MESSEKKGINRLLDIAERNKLPHDYFSFYLNFSTEKNFNPNPFINDFLLLPKLPILAKYNRNNYEMSVVLSLITFDYDMNKDKKLENCFNLPNEIEEYLKKFYDNSCLYPEIEKNTKNSKFHFNKQNSNYNTNVKFYWVCIENNLMQSNSIIYNIVPHLFLFDEFDFSQTKRIFINYPICMYLSDAMQTHSGLQEYSEVEGSNNPNFHNLKSGINFKNLRIEYSSIHLIKDSLGFSPNNLKFYLDTNINIAHFYLIILKDNTFHVFYYWILNNKNSTNSIKEIFIESENLKQLLQKLENSSYAKEQFVKILKDVFNVNV